MSFDAADSSRGDVRNGELQPAKLPVPALSQLHVHVFCCFTIHVHVLVNRSETTNEIDIVSCVGEAFRVSVLQSVPVRNVG